MGFGAPRPSPPAGDNMLDSMTTQFGLLNALRTGNMLVDMLIAMLLPLLFGGFGTILSQIGPNARWMVDKFRARNETTRVISYERRINQYGWSVGATSSDHYLQKALMLYTSKHVPRSKPHKKGSLTLTDLPKNQWSQGSRSGDDDGYDSGYDSDDCYGPSATLRNMEVSSMPPDGEWILVRDGVMVRRIHSSDNDSNEKMAMKLERTTVELSCKGPEGAKRISELVEAAYGWYKKSLEAQKDEKRYMFMMLRTPSKSGDADGDNGATKRLYKKYELSAEKTFSSLFFPDKHPLLYLLDHFHNKTGKFAIPGFPHKLGLLLHGPPGTGKTSLIKAIAHYTKRHIVSVPLSRIRTNQELMDVMFDKSFACVNTQRSSDDDSAELPMLLDFKHTIFVMEDVDAASKVVQRRAPKNGSIYQPKTITTTTVTRAPSVPTESDAADSGPAPIKPQRSNSRQARAEAATIDGETGQEETTVEVEEKVVVVEEGGGSGSGSEGPPKKSDYLKAYEAEQDKLDLAGLLNVLDGVVDSPNRIVIMTTNHPEKLDPALIRPGRINKQILMGYLLPGDAMQMVEHYFGPMSKLQVARFHEQFLANVFTPAQVEQLCAEYDSIDEFLYGLNTLTPNQY